MPKAPSCETPQASRGGVWGGVVPLSSRLGGLGERRKLPQWGPERSPGSLLIFFVSSSILCLKFKFNSQIFIIWGTDKSITIISNHFTGSKSYNACMKCKILSLTFKSLPYKYNKPSPISDLYYTTNSFYQLMCSCHSPTYAIPIHLGIKFQIDLYTFKFLFFGMFYYTIFALIL